MVEEKKKTELYQRLKNYITKDGIQDLCSKLIEGIGKGQSIKEALNELGDHYPVELTTNIAGLLGQKDFSVKMKEFKYELGYFDRGDEPDPLWIVIFFNVLNQIEKTLVDKSKVTQCLLLCKNIMTPDFIVDFKHYFCRQNCGLQASKILKEIENGWVLVPKKIGGVSNRSQNK